MMHPNLIRHRWLGYVERDMQGMFGYEEFNQDIGGWDIERTDINSMFSNAAAFVRTLVVGIRQTLGT